MSDAEQEELHRKDVVARNKVKNEQELTKAAGELRDVKAQYSDVDAACQKVSACRSANAARRLGRKPASRPLPT